MAKITIDDVARTAWEATCSEHAPTYDDLIPDYKAKLIASAEAVLAGEWPAEPWEGFKVEVCRLADGRGSMQIGTEQ